MLCVVEKMNKILTALILTVVLSGNVFAWTEQLDETSDGLHISHYFDEQNIRYEGKYFWYWRLMNIHLDNKQIYGKGVKSWLMYWKIDCNDRTQALFKIVKYAKLGGRGRVLDSEDYVGGANAQGTPNTFSYIIPNSLADGVAQSYCK